MNNLRETEEQTKKDCGQVGQAVNAATIESLNKEYRPSLHDRVQKQLAHSREEIKRCEKLAELNRLLTKNPEVARILDLIDEVRY